MIPGMMAAGAAAWRTGPTIWTPSQLSSRCWLDAADVTTLSIVEGSLVSAWQDKSGNSRNYAQASISNSPAFLSSGIGGLPAIGFDGVKTSLVRNTDSPIPLSGAEYSVFIVGRSGGLVNSNKTILAGGAAGTINAAYVFRIQNNGQFNQGWWNNNLNTSDGTIATNTEFIAAFLYTGSGRQNWLSGELVSDDLNTDKNTGAGISVIGGATSTPSSGPVADFFNGRIGEIVILPGPADTEARQRMEGYMAWKWGLVADLPITHPYKDAPPYV